jgi:hypothetical protein
MLSRFFSRVADVTLLGDETNPLFTLESYEPVALPTER